LVAIRVPPTCTVVFSHKGTPGEKDDEILKNTGEKDDEIRRNIYTTCEKPVNDQSYGDRYGITILNK